MENKTLSIAIATDDGITISQHFGRAMYYEVLSIENGKVVKRERREKMDIIILRMKNIIPVNCRL